MVTQIIQISELTPDQFALAIRGAIRSELTDCGLIKAGPKPDPDFITRQETADLLRISLVTLHKLTNGGILKKCSINGRVRYQRSQVIAAMEEVDTLRYKRPGL